MVKSHSEHSAENENQEFLAWLHEELIDYKGVFDLSDEDLRNRKILEIGSGDRRFAAACAINKIPSDVYSLEPALHGADKSGYASTEFLKTVIERLPADLQKEINDKTVVSTAEKTTFKDNSFDLVIGRSVPYESVEELANRLRELLRISNVVRIFPVDERNREDFEEALTKIATQISFTRRYKTTIDEKIKNEEGEKHVREDELIISR